MSLTPRNPAPGSRAFNTLALFALCLVQVFALVWQFRWGEVPCPLCLLQRVAFGLAGVGLILNIRFGPSPLHYAVVVASSLAGALVALRQVLLHIAPNDPGFGSPFLGLHFYTWALILFLALIVFALLMQSIDRKWGDNLLRRPLTWAGVFVMGLFLLLTLGNGAVVTLQCGVSDCPANGTQYAWASWLGGGH